VANVGNGAEPARGRGTLRRVLENTGWILGGKGFGALLSLIYIGLATRSLGVEGFGQFVLVVGAAQTASAFVNFSTWQMVVHFGASLLAEGRRDALDRLITFGIALDLGGALAGCVLATLGVVFLSPAFGWEGSLRTEALLFAFVMLLAVRSTALGILRLNDRFALSALADSITPAVRLLGALAAILTGPTIPGFLIAWACAEVATSAAYWVFTTCRTPYRWRWPFRASVLKVPREHPGLWRFVWITNAGWTLTRVSAQIVPIIVGLFVGVGAAGSYRIAHQLGQSLAKPVDTLSRAMFPEFAHARAADMSSRFSRLLRTTTMVSIGIAALVLMLLVFVGKPLLILVAGAPYASAYPLLLLVGAAAAIDVAGVAFEPALMNSGRAGQALFIRLLVAIALFAGLFALLPVLGAIGAGWARVGASLLSFVLFARALGLRRPVSRDA
jgi:O-antigen/teichoic acid export membrane protein